MPIRIISTNSIRAILAYWLKCTCSCQSRVKKWPGEFFPVFARSLLDIADIGLCRFPLTPPLSNIIRFYYCHVFIDASFSPTPRPLSSYSAL